MSPPLGIALAILIARKRFSASEQGSMGGLFIGGAGMITEFAIPFAAARPLRTIPALMAGSAVGGMLSYAFGLTMQAPLGGFFVIFLVNNVPLFLVALGAATVVTAIGILLLRPRADVEGVKV